MFCRMRTEAALVNKLLKNGKKVFRQVFVKLEFCAGISRENG